jgi:hypothetical protein
MVQAIGFVYNGQDCGGLKLIMRTYDNTAFGELHANDGQSVVNGRTYGSGSSSRGVVDTQSIFP